MLGGGTEMLLGDLIEQQYMGGAYNPYLGAAISLVMMVIVVICMVVMNRFGAVSYTHLHAAGQRHHVFHGGGQLHAHDILAGIDPEIVIHESVLYQPGHFQIRTGGHAAGGHPNAYFLCVRRAGKGGYRCV